MGDGSYCGRCKKFFNSSQIHKNFKVNAWGVTQLDGLKYDSLCNGCWDELSKDLEKFYSNDEDLIKDRDEAIARLLRDYRH